ncbi:hypothetical protein ACFVZU_36850, partial [Streptomyces collinus]
MSWDANGLTLRSRRGTDLEPSFPELRAGAMQLPDATALGGELVVWDAAGRLAFERLQGRLQRRGAGALRLAEQWPAHFVAFDLLRHSGTDTTGGPRGAAHRRRRGGPPGRAPHRQPHRGPERGRGCGPGRSPGPGRHPGHRGAVPAPARR